MSTDRHEHPRGYWMSVCISSGVAIGAALGVALENIGVGIALGVAIGAAIGTSLEERNKHKTRPLTEQERRTQRWAVTAGLASLLILAALWITFVFLRTR